jgi:hypothetical protein
MTMSNRPASTCFPLPPPAREHDQRSISRLRWGLSEQFGQPFIVGEGPGLDVGGTAGGQGHDHAHRFRCDRCSRPMI